MTLVWSRVLSSSVSVSGAAGGMAGMGGGGGGGSSATLAGAGGGVGGGGGMLGRNAYEGSLDIREIKEVGETLRHGLKYGLGECMAFQVRPCCRDSRDFAKWSEDVPKEAKTRCFVIMHGSEFNLKTLSCLTLYADDCAAWCQGVAYLVEDVRRASNRLHQVGLS